MPNTSLESIPMLTFFPRNGRRRHPRSREFRRQSMQVVAAAVAAEWAGHPASLEADMTPTTDGVQNSHDAGGAATALWSEIQRRVAEARDEREAHVVGEGLLTALLAEGVIWESTVAQAAREDPRLACALAHSSAGARIYELLGRDRLVEAYVRFAQPKVPGWWDGWSWGVLDWLLQDEPDEGWSVLVTLADSAPNEGVLVDIASQFLEEIVERRADTFVEWIVRDVPEHPNLRRAVQLAVQSGTYRGTIPSSPAAESIVAIANDAP